MTDHDVTFGSLLHPSAATRSLLVDRARPRMTWHQDVVTCLLGSWLLVGLYQDSWAHANQNALDSVLTPWHGVFYCSFGALAVWIAWHLRYHHDQGHIALAAIPDGYAGGLLGLGIFAVGAVGDQIWHAVFGIERDLKAFLSPTHLMLVIGMLLVVSSPLRSGWSDETSPDEPSFRRLLPAFWSLTLTSMLTMLIYQYLSTFPSDMVVINNKAFAEHFPGSAPGPLLGVFAARFQVLGLASIVLTTFMMVIPMLLAMRRWRLPFGCVTVFYTAMVSTVLASYQYNRGWTLLGAVIAGVLTDLLIVRLRPSRYHVWAFRTFAALAPVVLWSCYFAVMAIAYHVGWPAELSTGVVVLTSVTTLGISYLMAPSPIPRRVNVG